MSIWKVGKNELFHNKKVYIQYTDRELPTALQVQCGSTVYARKNERWIPDTARGWGMKRDNPLIRFFADTVIVSGCHGCPDRYSLLFVSWNQKPLPEDVLAYNQYCIDEKNPGFLGITASGSAVKTAVKKYMVVH
jgi:hypothetical protein